MHSRFLLSLGLLVAPLAAEVRLPALISDRMILQQDAPFRIWGNASANEAVRVSIAGQSAATTAGSDGRWEVWFKPVSGGGPHELRVAGSNTVTLRDILFGEVWVASGQSNMEWSVSRSNNPEQEIAKSDFPSIRFFQVKNTVADAPVDDVTGSWESCNPERTGAFSGVAYFFARDLHQRMRVPVGILQSDWGGTPAQAWTSKAALEADPRLHRYAENWSKLLANHPEAQARYEEQLAKWKQAAEEAKAAGRTPAAQPRPPMGPGSPHTPSGLYNAMIAPLAPFTIRGVIWYQGESNAGRVDNELYRLLFPAMIQDWRNAWNQGAFPFLFVQLANFAPPAAGTWPVLRESQLATLELRNTGMAVATDVGDSNDIHPKDKQTVGTRLALAARAIAYGEKITYSGPVYRQAATERGEMRLWFDHTGSGLRARGDKLTGFEIAGADRRFVPAEARIDGATVIVSSPQVQSPAAVRYAWANDPVANLINAEGLPATPFRTDRWPVE